jgi:hypothetical protein
VTVTCPACRARNDDGPRCRRCKADLTLLFALEERRAARLADAARHAAAGEPDAALVAAAEAERLRRGDDARRLRAVAHLLRRDFAAALACYRET